MSSSTDGLGTTSYGYDAAHQLTTTTPPSGTATTIAYSNGLPSSISGPVSVGMFYNAAGQLTQEFGGLDSPGFSYDANGRMTGADLASATYNADGKIATLTQSEPGNSASNTTTFGYDKAGRVQSATLARGGTTVSTTTYGWDADSNRTSMAVTGQPTIATSYNKADQATSDSAGTTYGYSLDGQLTSATDSAGTASEYTYDPYGKLAGSTGPNGTVSYARDALARVAARTAGSASQSYSYAGTSGLLVGQQSGGTTTNLVRDGSGTLYAMASAGGTALRVNPDIHGDIGQLVDPASHTTVWSAVYDPFGGALSTGTSPVGLGFQSMLTDPVTGLTDMGARSYNPASGTFTSADSLIGALGAPPALNRYLYGSGDPVGNFDPTGNCGFSLSLSNLESCASDLWSGATQLWDSAWSTASQLWDSAWSAASQAVSSAASWVARHVVPYAVTVAQDLTSAYHSISAVYSAMMCPQGSAVLHCAATGFLAGGVAGLALGPVAELGLGAVPADAIGSGGDAALGTSALDRLGAEVTSGDAASATADTTISGPGAPPSVSDTPAPATLADTTPGTITPSAAIEPAPPTPEAGINEGVNSVSNIGAGAAARSAETIAGAEPGSAFSGVYDPMSGRLSAYPSVPDPAAPGAPINAVLSRGGHGQINRAVFGGSDNTVGFTAFRNDDGISIGWRSRSVNVRNFNQIEAPMEYRQSIMDIIAQMTGLPVSG